MASANLGMHEIVDSSPGKLWSVHHILDNICEHLDKHTLANVLRVDRYSFDVAVRWLWGGERAELQEVEKRIDKVFNKVRCSAYLRAVRYLRTPTAPTGYLPSLVGRFPMLSTVDYACPLSEDEVRLSFTRTQGSHAVRIEYRDMMNPVPSRLTPAASAASAIVPTTWRIEQIRFNSVNIETCADLQKVLGATSSPVLDIRKILFTVFWKQMPGLEDLTACMREIAQDANHRRVATSTICVQLAHENADRLQTQIKRCLSACSAALALPHLSSRIQLLVPSESDPDPHFLLDAKREIRQLGSLVMEWSDDDLAVWLQDEAFVSRIEREAHYTMPTDNPSFAIHFTLFVEPQDNEEPIDLGPPLPRLAALFISIGGGSGLHSISLVADRYEDGESSLDDGDVSDTDRQDAAARMKETEVRLNKGLKAEFRRRRVQDQEDRPTGVVGWRKL